MPITRYYVCGEMPTVGEMAKQNGIEETISVIEFPDKMALHWFTEGLKFADGWLKIQTCEKHSDAVLYVDECMECIP